MTAGDAETKHRATIDALEQSPHATLTPVAAQAWLLRPGEAAALRDALRRRDPPPPG